MCNIAGTYMLYESIFLAAFQFKPIFRYVLGLLFGNVKRSKTPEKMRPARVFTQRVV